MKYARWLFFAAIIAVVVCLGYFGQDKKEPFPLVEAPNLPSWAGKDIIWDPPLCHHENWYIRGTDIAGTVHCEECGKEFTMSRSDVLNNLNERLIRLEKKK